MLMGKEEIDTVVVGAGQAGIAMSEHLSKLGIPHLVVERSSRIAENWQTARWDSLVANGPCWHDRFPGMAFDAFSPDDFVPKDKVADYFEAYARKFEAPVITGVNVEQVSRNKGKAGFTLKTSKGTIEAFHVVAATGPFQRPRIPDIAPSDLGVEQMHSVEYRNPGRLAEGAVLVIGSGSSGVQIADELRGAGRKVYLSVGQHERPPRSYRNRDNVWWLGVLNKWDAPTTLPGQDHLALAVTGMHGGHTIDFRALANQGLTLVGTTKSFENGVANFAPDLAENLAVGDRNYLAVLDAADAYIERNGLDLPEEPEARRMTADPECVRNPVLQLDLNKAGVTTIIWATGFKLDFSWLQVDAFDGNGYPQHLRGVSKEPGVYFLGLPWLTNRGSTFIWGVWHDAKFIADHIATKLSYAAYRDRTQRQKPQPTEPGSA